MANQFVIRLLLRKWGLAWRWGSRPRAKKIGSQVSLGNNNMPNMNTSKLSSNSDVTSNPYKL